MALYVLPNGIFESNTYILSDERECVVIDCGVNTREIMDIVESKGLHVKYIILTHGHFDHTYHVKSLKEKTGAKLCLHEDELELYQNPMLNGSRMFGAGRGFETSAPDILLKDGQKLQAADLNLEIIHTPGHSPGSICILSGSTLFTGDTLFAMSIGRTDFPGGSHKAMTESLQKLFTLDDSIEVYPGHGPKTTIGYEKEHNPYA
ncbi:MAG: MBL fold metallo-hydrolase [Clostridiaceae bacterium]|nr:MBL fold metallo-hydrolase [Clostridiaceae bacterium]